MRSTEAVKRARMAWRKRMLAQGLCPFCGKRKLGASPRMCDPCLVVDRWRKRIAQAWQGRKTKNLLCPDWAGSGVGRVRALKRRWAA